MLPADGPLRWRDIARRFSREGHEAAIVIREANLARDGGRFAEAVELYAQALTLTPDRVGIRIQLGNMLKDAGRYQEAEAEYRSALSQRPADAEIYLQLGHLQRTRGFRADAIANYRRAVDLAPHAPHASRELMLLGDREFLDRRFRTAGVTPEALRQLQLDLGVASGEPPVFPASEADAWRRAWAIPPPPTAPVEPATVIVSLHRLPEERIALVVERLAAQSMAPFRAILVADDTPTRDFALRLAETDPRFEVATATGGLGPLIASAHHDLLLLPPTGSLLHQHAVAWFVWALQRTQTAAFVCDEAPLADRRRRGPALGGVIDHEALLSGRPFDQAVGLDRRRCGADLAALGAEAAPRLALALELAARRSLGHIPLPLIERFAEPEDELTPERHSEVVRRHLARSPVGRTVERAMSAACIGIVIPTRDNGRDVQILVDSLRNHAVDPSRLRILVVDNGTTDEASQRILQNLAADGIAVVCNDAPFNWSMLSNLGARHCEGDILVFANDDMAMLTAGWDEKLALLLERPEVGVVGAKLLYPNNTIQHAGVLFGWRGRPIHDGLYEDRYAEGPGGRWQSRRRVSAVTGAFLAMRRVDFDELGGFDDRRLAISYSDLDLCLRVRRRGLAVLYAPEIELTHFESKSRGLTHLDPAHAAVEHAELAVMVRRWPRELDLDVTVNPAWHPAILPFRLLRAPSLAAIAAHIYRTASADPWLPGSPQPD